MAYSTSERIYGGMCVKHPRRVYKGRKKKARRMLRAHSADDWSRKQAGSLAPQFRPSKRELATQLRLQ